MTANPRLLVTPAFLLCSALTAHTTGIDPSLEFLTNEAGAKFIRWQGQPGISYFVLSSDPADHLNTWRFAPVIESGNGVEISYELKEPPSGFPDKGFFRLFSDDRSTSDPVSDDFDTDGISNGIEVMVLGTHPYIPNPGDAADTDHDGLLDAWEIHWFGNKDAQDGNGDPDGDGIINRYEQLACTDPETDEITTPDPLSDPTKIPAGITLYAYDTEGRLLSTAGTRAVSYTPDAEGNLENLQQ